MGDELVEPGPDLAEFPGCLLLHDLVGGLLEVHLPVQVLDGLRAGEGILRNLARLHHQDRATEVPATLLSDPMKIFS